MDKEPGGPQSKGLQRDGHDGATDTVTFTALQVTFHGSYHLQDEVQTPFTVTSLIPQEASP